MTTPIISSFSFVPWALLVDELRAEGWTAGIPSGASIDLLDGIASDASFVDTQPCAWCGCRCSHEVYARPDGVGFAGRMTYAYRSFAVCGECHRAEEI